MQAGGDGEERMHLGFRCVHLLDIFDPEGFIAQESQGCRIALIKIQLKIFLWS